MFAHRVLVIASDSNHKLNSLKYSKGHAPGRGEAGVLLEHGESVPTSENTPVKAGRIIQFAASVCRRSQYKVGQNVFSVVCNQCFVLSSSSCTPWTMIVGSPVGVHMNVVECRRIAVSR